jgi:hypothetical protein
MEPERGQPEPEPETEPLAPPDDLRPAYVGVLLERRLTLGHVGAALIDLVQRGLVAAEITDGPAGPGEPDWILTDRRGPDRPGPRYEHESLLLDSVFAGPSPLRLSELSADTVRTLDRVQASVLADMARWGWLRSVPHDPRYTERGGQVRRTVWAFRLRLGESLRAGRDLTGLAPYTAVFELAGDPLLTSWLAACGRYRDPELTRPGRTLFDEPVHVFVLNWVSPPGYQRFPVYQYHGLEQGPEHRPDGPSRLVRWLRAARLATRRGGG